MAPLYLVYAPVMDIRQRFLNGLADEAGIERILLDRPGTVLASRLERDGTGIIVVYEAGEHSLIWGDQQLFESLSDFVHDEVCVDMSSLTERLASLGSQLVSTGDMRVLTVDPPPPAEVPDGYDHRWLSASAPSDVDLVQAFADRSPPDDVEEADLDDLDDFSDSAINVLVPAGTDELIAYASAADWDWDPTFCDIGVLVDPGHRRKGLGSLVVGHTVKALLADDRLPLYRHDQSNTGSAGIADVIGFERVTSLWAFMPPG